MDLKESQKRLSTLPVDIQASILSFLAHGDLAIFAAVSRESSGVATLDQLWAPLLARQFLDVENGPFIVSSPARHFRCLAFASCSVCKGSLLLAEPRATARHRRQINFNICRSFCCYSCRCYCLNPECLTYHDISRREFCRTTYAGVLAAAEALATTMEAMDEDTSEDTSKDMAEDHIGQVEGQQTRPTPAWILALRLTRGLTLEGKRLPI